LPLFDDSPPAAIGATTRRHRLGAAWPGGRGHLIERKLKVRRVDPVTTIALMARIGGWEVPKKIAPTDAEGNDLNLLELVNASYELAAKRAAEAKAKENAA